MKNTLKVLSLFSGIGAFEKALTNLNIPYELMGFCEIDKYAAKSYCAIHNVDESLSMGDITKINESNLSCPPLYVDLLTYGFPCQDISIAGKQKGLFNEDGTQTRSGLFFEALKIIKATKPKIAIAENVKNLTSKKFSEQFKAVIDSLDEAGYNSYWQILNAKHYGVPQNRERVFIVSIRKDIDHNRFEFPAPFPLEKRLKDILEDSVDGKYYLSNNLNGISKTTITREDQRVKDNFIVEPEVRQIGNCCPTKTRDNPNQGRIYDVKGISPALNCMEGGNRQPFIVEDQWISPKGVKYICHPKRGMCTDVNADIAQTVTAKGQANWTDSFVSPDIEKLEKNTSIGSTCPTKIKLRNGEVVTSNDDLSNLRIRKLTPKECWRLMGFDDESFYKAEAVNSSTQLYKQAGNSIVVNVLEELFKMLVDKDGNLLV